MDGPTNRMRLALIDSDPSFVQVSANRMARIGWQHHALTRAAPVHELIGMRLNCLVVDLTVLEPDGWDYLHEVCRELPGLGVIVATHGSTVADRVRGLRLGADDWIDKPCHAEEVIARVQAVVRRRRAVAVPADREPVVAGELELRPDRFQAFVGGQALDLTRREFELLELLGTCDGQVLPREELYERVWGYTMVHGDRSVDVFVRKLRQKLEAASPGWHYIHTHFGIGYRFEAVVVDAPGDRSSEPDTVATARYA
jgi:DNA-binding response OmpR family regulator